jgi:hypothetical protein
MLNQADCLASGHNWTDFQGNGVFSCYYLAQPIEIIQQSVPPNDIYYHHIQFFAFRSMEILAPVYLIVFACGIFRRFVVARL